MIKGMKIPYDNIVWVFGFLSVAIVYFLLKFFLDKMDRLLNQVGNTMDELKKSNALISKQLDTIRELNMMILSMLMVQLGVPKEKVLKLIGVKNSNGRGDNGSMG